MSDDPKTDSWLQANLLVLVLILAVFLLLPFFCDGWAEAYCEEDAYYYFSVARNFAQGRGLTYAGEWTNGFQPLWLFGLSPIFLFQTRLITPVKIAELLGGIFFLLSGLMVYQSGRLLWKEKSLARFSSILWLSSGFAFEQAMNGMETGLYLFCLSCLVYIFLKRVRLNPDPGWRDWVSLGLISGICFLSRIDVGLILVPVWGAGVWHSHKRWRKIAPKGARSFIREFLYLGSGFFAFLAVALPWVGYNLWLWGNPLPVSALFARVQFWQEMTFQARAGFALKALLRIPLYYPLSFYTYFRHWNKMNLILLASGSLVWAAGFLLDRKLREELLRLPLVSMIFAGAFLTIGYVLPDTAHWFIPRYLLPVGLLLIFYIAVCWHRWLSFKPALIGIFCAILIAVFAGLSVFTPLYKNAYSQNFMNLYRLRNLDRIRTQIPAGRAIGSFQSGLYYYYLSPEGYQIYNLDGKMSVSAYRALRGHYLDQYLKQKRIVYLIDWSNYLAPVFKTYRLEKGRDYRIVGVWEKDYVAELLYNKINIGNPPPGGVPE